MYSNPMSTVRIIRFTMRMMVFLSKCCSAASTIDCLRELTILLQTHNLNSIASTRRSRAQTWTTSVEMTRVSTTVHGKRQREGCKTARMDAYEADSFLVYSVSLYFDRCLSYEWAIAVVNKNGDFIVASRKPMTTGYTEWFLAAVHRSEDSREKERIKIRWGGLETIIRTRISYK